MPAELPDSQGSRFGPHILAYFLVLCLIWGATYVVIKVGLQHSPPLAFTFLRAALGGAVLAVYAFATTRRAPTDRHTHGSAIVLGLTNVALFWGMMNLGLTHISAGESSILTYTQPLMVSVLAWAWLGEKLPSGKMVGLLLGFVGVVAVVGGKVQFSGELSWAGYVMTLIGALSWAIGTVYFKARQAKLDLLWITALQALYGAIPLAALTLALEQPRLDLSWELAWAVGFCGLGSSALAYLLWFYLLRHRSASEVTAYIFLVPLFAVLFGALVLGERLGALTLLGACLILGGIYLVNRVSLPSSQPQTPLPKETI